MPPSAKSHVRINCGTLIHRPPENNLHSVVWIPPSVCQGLNVQSTEYHRSLSTDAEVALDGDYLLNLCLENANVRELKKLEGVDKYTVPFQSAMKKSRNMRWKRHS